ncbi:YbaB/EbfC family nucleoid-associated protein [Streptomyces sp. NPDC006476]|uniref:YbaB/EbfC family nucleoid-associated protein n=1 Tax=Streptomyces sp. NPDC006476 TaxID=3157175 RepID=UPI0033B12A35
MTTPYDRQIEELLQEYRRQRENALALRSRINETTGAATAPKQVVKVTVSAQGEVTAIEFPTGAFRRLAPKELADVLMSTIQQARVKAMTAVGELMNPHLPAGVTTADLLEGKADPTALLSEEPAMPDSVRDYVNHGYRRDQNPPRR